MKISIPISVGELLDKISILQIKFQYTDNEYVQKELQDLIQIAQDLEVYDETHLHLLFEVNSVLWGVEDKIREKEKLQEFDDEFIELARSVYKTNDRRAEIKKMINEETNSHYKEIKLY
jgi:hypothetical protein